VTRAAAWLIVRLSFVLVPAWIGAAVAAAHFLPTITARANVSVNGLVPGGAEAIDTQQREVREFGSTILTRVVVVQHANRALTRAQLERTARLALDVDRRHARPPIAFAAPLVSRDGTTTITYLYYRADVGESTQLSSAQAYARALSPPGLRGGAILARTSEFDEIQAALPRVTLATVVLIVIVLLLMFRSAAAPLVGLSAAGIAYVVSVHLLAWIGREEHRSVPKEVEPILIALLLGLVTDYAVFFMAAMRRHLAAGERRFRAAHMATTENLPIILTAGLIVALGAMTLVVGHLAVFRAFGPGMALTVAVAVAVAVTFIPALLALLGPWLFWPSLRRTEREPRRRFWRVATARPVSAAVALVSAAGLVVLATGLVQARLGFTIVRGLPGHSEAKKAQQAVERGFPAGIVAPTEVLLEAPRLGRAELAALQQALRTVPHVAEVVGPADVPRRLPRPVFVAPNGRAARYAVVFDQEPLDATAIHDLRRLQHAMPSLLQRAGLEGARVSYAGDTALAEETVDAIRSDALRVGVAVLLVNLVLLMIFLRAVWAPVYLLFATVLALGAALGATTYVMEVVLGHDDLTYYVPFAAGVLLLSLGSDYNVFIVGRIWQVARERPLREAIAEVAPRASRTIVTAGLTLTGSFALLALVPVRPMRELAFAMAAGLLLDTFVVRSLLVPSLLALFRRRRSPPVGSEGASAG
jgi:RND superfamily putative drug exporter